MLGLVAWFSNCSAHLKSCQGAVTIFAMKKALSLSVALVLASCATLPEPDIIRIAAAVKEAATLGTSEAVRDHPEWRPHFDYATEELELLEKQDQITVANLLDVLSRLPVSELSSDQARIIMSVARLTIAVAGWSDVKIVQTQQLRPVIIALREGIDAGLAQPVVPLAKTAKIVKHYRVKR